MRFLRQIKESPNYGRLKNSVELRSAKKDLLFVGIFFLVMTLLLVPGLSADVVRPNTMSFVLVYFFLFLPLLVYALYRVVILFVHIDRYVFSEAVLDKPHQSGRNGMYFTVTLRDRYGREFQADTRAIFSTGDPNFEDYLNQRVLIGYNEETECVVVIQKLP